MTQPTGNTANTTLIVMRHGKSDWNAGAADDASRPLSGRGEKTSRRMGKWLKNNAPAPDLILASPAVRTRETARIAAAAIGIPADRIRVDERLYHAGTAQHLEVLGEYCHQHGTLLLVGHNPGLEELLEALCSSPPDIPEDGKLLPTAAVAVLDIPSERGRLQPGQAVLRKLIRPRELPE